MSRKRINKGLWIDRFPDWVRRVIDEHPTLTPEDIEYAVQTAFKFIYVKISNPTYPIIRLKTLGVFYPSLKKVNFSMRNSIKTYRRGVGRLTTVIATIKKLWPIRQRLQQEAKGAYTYRDWKQYHKASEGQDKIIYVSNTYTTTKYTDEKLCGMNGEEILQNIPQNITQNPKN